MKRTYIPGVCNLSDGEARQRNIAGWVGLILTIILEAYFIYAQLPLTYRLVIFLPATIGAIGFLQGVMHFCVSFGMNGVFNVSNDVGKTDTVAQAEFRAQDKVKAIKIMVYSILIGLVTTGIAYIL
jgi:aminopeptidase-like protein